MEQDANEYYLRQYEAEQKRISIEAEERSARVDEVAERMKRDADEGVILSAFLECSDKMLRTLLDDYKTAQNSKISDDVPYAWLGRSSSKIIDAYIRREAEIEVDK